MIPEALRPLGRGGHPDLRPKHAAGRRSGFLAPPLRFCKAPYLEDQTVTWFKLGLLVRVRAWV